MIHELFKVLNWAGSEWVLVVLAGLSVVVGAVVIQRWMELQRLAKQSAKFWSEQGEQWLSGDLSPEWRNNLAELKAHYPSLEVQTLDVIAKAEAADTVDPESAAGAFLEHKKIGLEKYINIVGTIGGNAAFVGLLGTVLGIIRAFNDMSTKGLSGMESINGGIAEALVATAVGLCVAIPAVIFFNVLNRKISTIVRRAETVGALVVNSKR